MKKLMLPWALVLLVLCSFSVEAQDFTNKGRDFWIGYGNHVRMFNGGGGGAPYEKMQLYLTSDVTTTGQVTIPSVNFSQAFTVTANQITTIDIPRTAILADHGLYNHGIHVTAIEPVVVYSFIYVNAISGATLCLPTNTLGKEYYSVNYTQSSNEPNSHSYFFVIATDTGTTNVEITPSAITKAGQAANTPFTVSLTQGQIYQVLGQTINNNGVDLTGSRIRSISTSTGGCKKIAVYSGSGKISIGCANPGSSDNLYQQMYPTNTWGKKYITTPGLVNTNNFFRIAKSDPTAVVTLNGAVIPASSFINGFYYQFSSNIPNVIVSDKPILVAQYFTTQGCAGNGSPGDPEMIFLNPIEQTIDKVTLNSMQPSTGTALTQHHLNVVLKNSPGAINSFRIDGTPFTNFIPVPSDPGYVYARITTTSGTHNVTCDTGFNIIAYGFGNAESYGYSGGANIKDLYQFVSIQNQFASVDFPSICRSSPFYFSMSFPYQPTQIKWLFNGLFADVTINNPVPDSTWTLNGRQLYKYKLPGAYTTNVAAGTYPIKVIAQNPTADGCGNEQVITYDLQVFNKPTAAFTFASNGCVSNPVQFTDAGNTNGRPATQWNWNFDDPGSGANNTSGVKNPSHLFSGAGTFQVKYSFLTDVGCVSDTATMPVNLAQSPVAKFGASAPFCIGSPVTFSDTSSSPAAPIAKWYWNFGDGGTLVATTNTNQLHTYATAGTFTVTLQVETSTGCKSSVFSRPVTVTGPPSTNFTFGNACLPGGVMQFTNSSTNADGSATGLTFNWDFGDGGLSTATNPVHNYTSVGPFNVKLTTTTANGCTSNIIKPVNTIYAQPKAAFTTPQNVCVGSSTTFTDQSTAANSTITEWLWMFGDGTTSTVQNPVKNFNTAGPMEVKLVTKSAAGCPSDTARTTINIYALPTLGFTVDPHRCEGDASQFNSTSVSNGGNITQYNWTVNGTAVGTNSSTLNYTPASSGTVVLGLSVLTDKGCTNSATQSITIYPKPQPEFTLPVVCLPAGTAQFTNNTTISDGTLGSITYTWNFGDGGTSTVKSPTHTYSSLGPFNVKLTAASANGCVKDITKTLSTVYAQPVSAFNAPAEVCLGNAASFTDQSSASNSTVTNWLWSFGDGGTSNVQNPTHTFTTAGTHEVTLKITSAAGCPSGETKKTVIVNPLPVANFQVSVPNCVSKDILFTDVSVANAGMVVEWTWNMGDGTNLIKSTNAPFTHSYSTTGQKEVTLQVRTNKGCISAVFKDTVMVHPFPVPGFMMPENCINDPFSQFTDTSTIEDGTASGFTYLWNFGDPNATPTNPNTSTQKNPRHKYTQSRSYDVKLTVTSVNGCSIDLTQQFIVNGDVPQASFAVQNGLQHCSNNPVNIINQSSVDFGAVGKVDIFWDYANDPTNKTTDTGPTQGKIYSKAYPEFFTPATKTYQLRMIAYSGDNCTDDTTITITVKATPQISFGPLPSACLDTAAFQITQATILNGMTGGVFSGPGMSTAGMFTPSAAGPGTHTIRYTVNAANGCTNYKEQTITIFPVPKANAGPDKIILEGGSGTLDGVGNGDNITFLWTPPQWLNDNTDTVPVVTPLDDITYTLTVTSKDGCRATDKVFVRVLKAPTVPNVFTPNGDGINDRWEIEYLETYPGASVDVYNSYGQIVFQSINYLKPWDGSYKGKPLPVGTYYYIINPKNGRKQIAGYVDIVR